MQTKLILVEGIPGSGKSTFAELIAQHYQSQGIAVNLYNEGGFHPADLAWNACVPIGELEAALAPYQSFRAQIDQNTHIEYDYAIISYTQVHTDNAAFYKDMERYEVYDNRVPFQTFSDLHLKRWQSFAEKAGRLNELTVFECALLQNHINELMYFHLADIDTMQTYFHKLAQTVRGLSPLLVYLSPSSVRDTILRVAEERVFPDGRWIDGIVHYFENTPYGKLHHRQGLEGAIQSFEDRKHAELAILTALPIQSLVLENRDNDWEKLWQTLKAHLPV